MNQPIEQALLLKQAVDAQTDGIVKLAEDAWTEKRVSEFKNSLGQLSNAIGVATQTESPRVVTSWIAYQMGRKETRRKWGETGLGEAILKHIQELDNLASGITMQVYQDDSPQHRLEVHIHLIRQYLGFLRRWCIAKGGQQS